MLHNFLIATALAFSDDPYLRSRSFRDKFINEGKRRLDAELENPTLSTVQSLALLSTYCSSVGEQTSGWMYFGEYFAILF
ncbi:hypothetical protein DL93DRAFT_2058769 [Clavulina sp. PMI_390]|nr:hypothetical protein DL93DRAFT_2058769 [Clavulina sp. PMI_390]